MDNRGKVNFLFGFGNPSLNIILSVNPFIATPLYMM